MSIMSFVLIIFPGIIAAEYYQRIRKVDDKGKAFICNCALFIFLINFVSIFVIQLRGWDEFTFDTMGAVFIIKYMAMGLVLAYVMPHVYKFVAYIIGRYITGSINSKENKR